MIPADDLHRERRAEFSPCGAYRYRLEHVWDRRARPLYVVCLNPSTADAHRDDPTVRKLVGFAIRANAGGFVLGNLYAWRATEPRDLWSAIDPVGPDNDSHLQGMLIAAGATGATVVAAWGAHARPERAAQVAELARRLEVPLHCWGRTAAGEPRHPLMLAYSTPLEPFTIDAGRCNP